MEQQPGYSYNEYCLQQHQAREKQLLAQKRLEAVIEFYSSSPIKGHPSAPLATKCCIRFSDPAPQSVLHELSFMQRLTGTSNDNPIPDFPSNLNTHYLLECHESWRQIFEAVNNLMAEQRRPAEAKNYEYINNDCNPPPSNSGDSLSRGIPYMNPG